MAASAFLLAGLLGHAQDKGGTTFSGGEGSDPGPCAYNTSNFMSEQDVNRLVTDMLDRIDINNRYLIVACRQVENCQAILYKGRPYILYNPNFLEEVKRLNFSATDLTVSDRNWEALTILAHELGHHVNNHLSNPLPDATARDMELEADQFAGSIIYRMGGTKTQAVSAYRGLSETGSYTHPGRQQRMDAIGKGWEKARARNPAPNPTPSFPVVTPVTNPTSSWVHAADFEKDLVPVKGGSFNPVIGMSVTLDDYRIGRYEVTQEQWRWVMGSDPSFNKGCDRCPVESVTWKNVQAFLVRLNELTGGGYRLPTESEWIYAYKGGNLPPGNRTGGKVDKDEMGWHVSNSGNRTQPVGSKRPNPLGLFDMLGNVSEYCADMEVTNHNKGKSDKSDADERCVAHGSSFRDNNLPDMFFTTTRKTMLIGSRGFRLVYQRP